MKQLYNFFKSLFGANKDHMNISDRINNIITSTADSEELKNKITKEIAIALNASRCFFIEYNSQTNNFKKITNLYSTKRELPSLLNYDIEKNLNHLAVKLKYLKYFIIEDSDLFVKENNLEETKEAQYFKDFNVKSFLAVRLQFGQTFLGLLAINFDYKKNDLKKTDLKILQNIAENLSIALHLSALYIEERKKGEREKLLSSIVSIMAENYNLKKINQKIFNILGKIYNTQSIFIDINTENLKKFYFYNFFNDKPNDFKNYEQKALIDIYNFNCFNVIKNRVHYINNTHHFIISNNLENTSVEKYFKKNNIKSVILLPIVNEFLTYGLLIMHFNIKNPIEKEDLELIKTTTSQLGIIIKKVLLYKKEQQTSLNLKAILDNIPYWTWMKDLDNRFILANNQLAKDKQVEISDFIGKNDYDFFPKELADTYHNNDKTIMESGQTEIIEEETIIKGQKRLLETFKRPIYDYEGKIMGTIGIAKDITEKKEAEKQLLQKQEEIIKANNRETLLRNIFEKIRSSLDIDETLSFICEETAKIFNVQRSAITVFPDLTNLENFELKKEFKSSPNIKSFLEIETCEKIAAEWGRSLIKDNEVLSIDNINESNINNNFKNSYANIGVKAIIGTAIRKGNDIWGTLVLSDCENYRNWSEDEKQLLSIIADQTYIAINQAELYEKQKLATEKEKMSRNLIEILRSSIDKTIIKKLFVKNIGKFFNADRVFFAEYNPIEKMYLPIDCDSEYLSSPNEKSFMEHDWSIENTDFYIKPLLEKREIKIPNWNKFINQMPEMSENLLHLQNLTNVQSSYGFPIIYQDILLGFFCIDFTQKVLELTEEDIRIIRSICTQAGIALYHADLYLKAQECYKTKIGFEVELLNKIKKPSSEILDDATSLYQNDFERPVQIEYINNILNSCHQLIELTQKT